MSGARLIASHPWGENEWFENGIHIVCQASWMPDFVEGGNRMGGADDALFLGTIINEFGEPYSNGPLWVQQNENTWPGSILGVPMIVPYTGLYLDSTNIEILFKDASPALGVCTSNSPIQAVSQLKFSDPQLNAPNHHGVTVYPIPASDALTIDWGQAGDEIWHQPYLRILDMNGRVVLEEHGITTSQTTWTLRVNGLPNGFYRVEMRTDENLIGAAAVIIDH
jgi:hypothetical protein